MKTGYQFSDYLPNLFRLLRPLQSQELRDQALAFIQFFSRHSAFVQQKMPMLGTIILQTLRHGSEQGRHFLRRFPCLASIVYNNGEHRRQPFVFTYLSRLDEIKQKQGRIGQRSQGHPVVGRALELQKQRHIAPGTLFPADTPDNIVMAFPQVVRHITARTAFKRRKIQVGDEIGRHEIPQQ